MIGVVVSRADRASERIGEALLDLDTWTVTDDTGLPPAAGGGSVHRSAGFELRTFDGLHLELDAVADAFANPDLVVFASRHSGETGPLLTAHHTGNVGAAEFGGRPHELSEAAPNALATLFQAFERHAPPDYDVGLECTHHGPSTVGAPSVFAELGSGPEQWTDEAGATAVAKAIHDLRGVAPVRDHQFVGVGGSHYAPRFARVVAETDWAVGHVLADWALDELDDPADRRAILDQAVARSAADVVLLDGPAAEQDQGIPATDHRIVSETWLRQTSGTPLEVVDRIEARLGSIEDGVRIGERASDASALTVDHLPSELLEAANGVDREAVRRAIAAEAVAYETREGGSLVAGPVALDADTDFDSVVEDLVTILADAYETVERRSGAVVATRLVFDPEAARELGVPEGPAFGRLADGEAVTVDGETITPSMVFRTETCRFEIS